MAEYKLANLDQWATKTKERMLAVVHNSVERVCEVAQTPIAQGGRMPVVTGTLRNSFMSSLNGEIGLAGPSSYTIIVAQMEIGDSAEFGWGGLAKAYAARQNYGFVGVDNAGRKYNQAGKHFLENAIGQFPAIVAEEIAKAKSVVAAL